MDFKNTKSPSSATLKTGVEPIPNDSDNYTINDAQTSDKQPLGVVPIKVSNEVQYKEYENDKRVTEDFGSKDSDDTGNSPLDGTDTMDAPRAPKKSFVSTNFSK